MFNSKKTSKLPPVFIVFLDVDGVLTTTKDVKKLRYRKFSPSAVKALKSIIAFSPQVRIVVSSVWRNGMGLFRFGVEWGKHRLADRIVIDRTPYGTADNRYAKQYNFERGAEIRKWLRDYKKQHPNWPRPDIQSFVILDDDIQDIQAYYPNQLLKTNPYYGLTMKDAARAIKYFKKSLDPKQNSLKV